MTTTRAEVLELAPKAMAELFKPARIELVESLQVTGPATIAQLAARLGRPPDSLYYHVKKMVEIGVMAERPDLVSDDGRPGRTAAVYELTAKTISLPLDSTSRRNREVWGRGAGTLLRQAGREVSAALESGQAQDQGAQRNLLVRRMKVRLGRKELEQVNQHLEALQELLASKAENTQGQPFAVTLALTPVLLGTSDERLSK